MQQIVLTSAVLLATAICLPITAMANEFCVTAGQARVAAKYFADNPGVLPPIAAQRLGWPDALAASGVVAAQAASAPAADFVEIWTAMASWEQANFLIMKGRNVFEILSGVSAGAPSTRSDYFNIEYDSPLRGHLRPDLMSSIYAISMPGSGDAVTRGVMFFDGDGSLVMGAFMSGESLDPGPEEIAKFDELMALVRSKRSVCSAQ